MNLTILQRRPGAVAVILGVVAALATALYFRSREARLADLGRPLPCLIAGRDLPAQTQLEPTMLAVIELPRQFLQPGAICDLPSAVGQVTQAPIAAGEQITRTRVYPPGDGHGFAATIPRGKRAVSIAVDAVSGVAGLIEPGNFVDCLATFDFGEAANTQSFTMTLLEGAPVVAVDQRVALLDATAAAAEPGTPGAPRARAQEQTVTLALTPTEAQKVIFAQEGGRLRLSLRSQQEPAPTGNEMGMSREPATAASVTGMTNLVKRKEYRGR